MDLTHWKQIDQYCWSYSDAGSFPLIAYGDQQCVLRMHPQVLEQAWTLSQLPGLSTPVILLPDAHPGFAMPNGCVVGFDANHGGAILSGDIHLDHAYGVRCLKTGLQLSQLEPQLESLSETLQSGLAAGLIQRGLAHCNQDSFDLMLRSGAHWAVEEGWGFLEDLQFCEHHGLMPSADPCAVSAHAKDYVQQRLKHFGNGNHHVELHVVDDVYDLSIASHLGLHVTSIVVVIEAGSAGLSQQTCRDNLSALHGLTWTPLHSELGHQLLASIHASLNCALAYRQILTHLVREVFRQYWPDLFLPLLVDASHNSVQKESHLVGHDPRHLWVQRQGSTRAFGPCHGHIPDPYRQVGQPVLLGGGMGSFTEVLCGIDSSEQRSLSTSCWNINGSLLSEKAGLVRRVARLRPLRCIQG